MIRGVHRRRFVTTLGLATASLATRSIGLAAREPRRIAVVGGGIVGASIAYHLAKRGAEVHLFEKRAPATVATANSFAWINAGAKRPRGYYELNRLGMAGWRRLQQELGPSRLVVQWGGTLQWQGDPGRAEAFRRGVVSQQAWGYGSRLVDVPEMRRLVPFLEPGPVSAASFCDEEGTLDPVAATHLLLEAAVAHGAVVRHPAAVSAFDLDRVYCTTGITSFDGAINPNMFFARPRRWRPPEWRSRTYARLMRTKFAAPRSRSGLTFTITAVGEAVSAPIPRRWSTTRAAT